MRSATPRASTHHEVVGSASAEGDGNAPLVDPFGPPARLAQGGPQVSATGGPLPPLAHEVEPFLPTPPAALISRRGGIPNEAPPYGFRCARRAE
jgi:hypothetical protein